MRSWGDSRAAAAFAMIALTTCCTFSSSAAAQCVPECRSGYVCVEGQCVSACNPPCAAGERCTAEAECVAAGESPESTVQTSHAPSSAAADDGTIAVRFAPRVPDLGLSILQPDGSFQPLCVGACETRLAAGVYTFGVARYGRAPLAAPPIPLRSEGTLTATYRNRRAMRTTGWIIAATGLGLMLSGFIVWPLWGSEDADVFAPIIASGGATMGIGLGMTFAKDRVTVGIAQP
jgi:hypothetical protein